MVQLFSSYFNRHAWDNKARDFDFCWDLFFLQINFAANFVCLFFFCLVPKKWPFWILVFFKAFPELFVKFLMVQASGYFELSLQFLLTKRVFEVFSFFLFLISISHSYLNRKWREAQLCLVSKFVLTNTKSWASTSSMCCFFYWTRPKFLLECFFKPISAIFFKSKKLTSLALEQARYQISFCPLLF